MGVFQQKNGENVKKWSHQTRINLNKKLLTFTDIENIPEGAGRKKKENIPDIKLIGRSSVIVQWVGY